MENFRQSLWTSGSAIVGDIPELDSFLETLAYPDVETSYSDLPMADYPPPLPLIEESNRTYVDLDDGHTVHIEHLDDSFNPENLLAGKFDIFSYKYIFLSLNPFPKVFLYDTVKWGYKGQFGVIRDTFISQ